MCIDETEVTEADYAEFLSAVDPVGTEQPDACSWNDSFVPFCVGGDPCTTSDCGSFPQTCIDWCDAYAYCKWAGKHLCGPFAGHGTGEGQDGFALTTENNEWLNACVAGQAATDAMTFPYGGEYVATRCNTGDDEPVGALPVKSKPECQASGPYAGVFDLSGNVAEWVDACGSQDSCRVMGGDYVGDGGLGLEPGNLVSCHVMSTADRALQASTIGFRCCG
jgi:formylglycine-generating enzyme required for sulfatase activity